MRDPNRIPKMLEELEVAWLEHPDMRLGQLILNLARGSVDIAPMNHLWNLEDDEFLVDMVDWNNEHSDG